MISMPQDLVDRAKALAAAMAQPMTLEQAEALGVLADALAYDIIRWQSYAPPVKS